MAANDNLDSLIDDILEEHDEKKRAEAVSEEAAEPTTPADNEPVGDIPAEPTEEPVPAGEEQTVPEAEEEPAEETEPAEEADIPEEEYSDYVEEEDEPQPKRTPKKRKRRFSTKLVVGLLLTTMVIVVSILLAVFILQTAKEIIGFDKPNTEIIVEIPNDSGTEKIAELLESEGIIDQPMLFRVYSKMKGADSFFIAGSHKLSPSMSYGDIIDELQSDAINMREVADVTFPEGITLVDAAARLEEKGVCSAADFIDTFNSASFGFDFEDDVRDSSLKYYKMEGYLFPDTYRFYLEEDPLIVSKKIYKNFDAKLTRDYLGRMEDMGMTLEETLTFASIVQAEAGDTANMKRVASVFHNRLKNKDEFPLLQSDPTSKYVREVICASGEYVSENMKTAYDTYKGAGLPPGPICNPGLDAINAVLYPADTDYYYFCSNLETGEFYYAKTLEEHEENLKLAGLA